jgi:hypothetical protein
MIGAELFEAIALPISDDKASTTSATWMGAER